MRNPDGLFVPVSLFNELRRQLYAQISVENKKGNLPETDAPHRIQTAKWVIKTDSLAKIAAIAPDEADEIIYLLNEQSDVNELKKLPKNKLRLALPTVCRRVDKFKPLIEALLAQGYKNGKSVITGDCRCCRKTELI